MTGAVAALAAAMGIRYGLPTAVADSSAGVAAVGTLNFTTAGGYSCVGNTLGTTQSGNWIVPTTFAPGSYTIRLHLNSGTAPGSGPALDTDLALSSNRTWTWTQAAPGTTSANLTLTLKDGSGNTVLTSTLSVSVVRSI